MAELLVLISLFWFFLGMMVQRQYCEWLHAMYGCNALKDNK